MCMSFVLHRIGTRLMYWLREQMGASLCTLGKSCCTKLPEDDTDEDVSARENSTLELLKPKGLKSEAKGTDNTGKDVKSLGQWMLSSPCVNPDQDVVDASRVHQIHRQSAKVSPASCERTYSTPRESFSVDWPSRGGSLSSTPRRSPSSKRVSFKLPEDADIHFFCVCDDEKEEGEWEL